MLSNKIHLLKKIKENTTDVFCTLKDFKKVSKKVDIINSYIDLIQQQNSLKDDKISLLEEKCKLLEKDIANASYSISILNFVLEAIIYDDGALESLKKNIKYH